MAESSQLIKDYNARNKGTILRIVTKGLNGEDEFRYIKDGMWISGADLCIYLDEQLKLIRDGNSELPRKENGDT